MSELAFSKVGERYYESERTSQKLNLDLDGLRDDLKDGLGMRPLQQVTEEQARKVRVHTLITRDELVRERQTRHETTLLEPEDGGERPAEEDTLDGSERDETLSKRGALV